MSSLRFESRQYKAKGIAMITLKIDDIPSSNNKYIGRDARWAYQDEKKKWAWLIKAAAAPVKPGKPYEYADVTLRYSFKDRRRRDPDNYSGKMILDGLVGAGIIKDDSFTNIRLILEAEFGKDKGTEIIVKARD